MGSQAVYNARVDAPAAIVVRTAAGWVVATVVDAWQPDRSHGGMGPVVLTYKALGTPYTSEETAQKGAALIVAKRAGD